MCKQTQFDVVGASVEGSTRSKGQVPLMWQSEKSSQRSPGPCENLEGSFCPRLTRAHAWVFSVGCQNISCPVPALILGGSSVLKLYMTFSADGREIKVKRHSFQHLVTLLTFVLRAFMKTALIEIVLDLTGPLSHFSAYLFINTM